MDDFLCIRERLDRKCCVERENKSNLAPKKDGVVLNIGEHALRLGAQGDIKGNRLRLAD